MVQLICNMTDMTHLTDMTQMTLQIIVLYILKCKPANKWATIIDP